MLPPSPQTLKRHGLTEDSWRRLYKAQGGRCGLCGKPPRSTLVIDHDHRSNEVRGLLCPFTCNGRLGKVRDDAAWMRRAVDYLADPPARRAGIVRKSTAAPRNSRVRGN